MVTLQPIIVRTTPRADGVFVRIRNRPNYGLSWIQRALEGLKVEVSPVLHGEGEWWVTASGTDSDPRVLEANIRQRFSEADKSETTFEPPPGLRLANTA